MRSYTTRPPNRPDPPNRSGRGPVSADPTSIGRRGGRNNAGHLGGGNPAVIRDAEVRCRRLREAHAANATARPTHDERHRADRGDIATTRIAPRDSAAADGVVDPGPAALFVSYAEQRTLSSPPSSRASYSASARTRPGMAALRAASALDQSQRGDHRQGRRCGGPRVRPRGRLCAGAASEGARDGSGRADQGVSRGADSSRSAKSSRSARSATSCRSCCCPHRGRRPDRPCQIRLERLLMPLLRKASPRSHSRTTAPSSLPVIAALRLIQRRCSPQRGHAGRVRAEALYEALELGGELRVRCSA